MSQQISREEEEAGRAIVAAAMNQDPRCDREDPSKPRTEC